MQTYGSRVVRPGPGCSAPGVAAPASKGGKGGRPEEGALLRKPVRALAAAAADRALHFHDFVTILPCLLANY